MIVVFSAVGCRTELVLGSPSAPFSITIKKRDKVYFSLAMGAFETSVMGAVIFGVTGTGAALKELFRLLPPP